MPASLLAAGWDEANWPSWSNNWSGYKRQKEVYSATVERAGAAFYAPTVDSPAWFSQRLNLKRYKGVLRTIIPNYVNHHLTNASGNFNDWMLTGTNLPPMLTITQVLDRVNAPSNYLDYTPWFNLNGRGRNTNDTSVGYPYGGTNTKTGQGGDYFPAGRSTWYSTDYGWIYMRAILSELYTTRYPLSQGYGTRGTYVQNRSGGHMTNASWAAVRQEAIDSWDGLVASQTINRVINGPYIFHYGEWGDQSTHYVVDPEVSRYGRMSNSTYNIYDGTGHRAQWYALIESKAPGRSEYWDWGKPSLPYSITNATFFMVDDIGVTVTSSVSITYAASTFLTNYNIYSNLPTAAPTIAVTNYYQEHDEPIGANDGQLLILRWNVPGGFVYEP